MLGIALTFAVLSFAGQNWLVGLVFGLMIPQLTLPMLGRVERRTTAGDFELLLVSEELRTWFSRILYVVSLAIAISITLLMLANAGIPTVFWVITGIGFVLAWGLGYFLLRMLRSDQMSGSG